MALMLLLGCGDSAVEPNPGPAVASVAVTPALMDLFVSDTIRLVAEARSETGAPIAGRAFNWNSDRLSVASVDAAGLVTALGVGSATVSATSGGRIGSATVRIAARVVASVEVTPTEAEIVVGDTLRLAARARAGNGSEVTGHTVVWSSTRVDVASVSPDGLATAHGEGEALVSASVAGVEGSALITVALPAPTDPVISSVDPKSIQAGWDAFTLTVRGVGFAPQSRVLWEGVALETFFVNATELRATVSSSYVAVEGSFQITVETPLPAGVSNAWPFAVTAKPALFVELRIAGNAVFVGDRLRLSAVARDQFGEIIEGKTITWSSSDSTVAKVEGDFVHGLREGSVALEAHASPAHSGMLLSVVTSPAAGVVFDAAPAQGQELFVRALDPIDGVRRLLPPGTIARQAAVTADGGRIAFVGKDVSGNQDVYVIDSDRTNLRRLTTETGIDDQPAWSRDGQSITFRSFRHGKSDIWVMNADGSDQRNVTFAPVFVPEEHNERPAWSPDGGAIVFSRGVGITQSLFKIDVDGSGMTELVTRPGSDLLEPHWSDDGAVIAFRRLDRVEGRSVVEFVSGSTGEPIYYFRTPPADSWTPVMVGGGWVAVSAPVFPASTERTVAFVQLHQGYVVAPMGEEYGTLREPAILPR